MYIKRRNVQHNPIISEQYENRELNELTHYDCSIVEVRDETICSICKTNQANIILSPCGHKCICYECSTLMQNNKCPLCRIQITTKLKYIPN